jgi:hypothetical protein
MRRLSVLVLAAACGSGSPPSEDEPLQRAAPVISAIAPREGADDLEVAKVNGRPVWGSCVVHQMSRGARTREAALDECIQFELLAQTAEQRGLAADPTVVEATRRELVSREVAVDFEARTASPADLGERMTKWLTDNAWRMHRPDLRASSYARVNVPKGAPPEVEAKAKALSEQIAAALATEVGLLPANVKDTAERIGKGSDLGLDIADVKPTPRTSLDKPYADALYAVPEIGRIAGPVRTQWGWDVILWNGGLPPKESTQDEIAAEVFPELRRAAFQFWVNDLVKKLGIKIEIDPALVARLEAAS